MPHEITFLDSGREPQCASDPAFPLGRDSDISQGATITCKVTLPYPAPRCGSMLVRCLTCGYSAACTVADRVDDPRTTKLPCKSAVQ
jgi:hypothetical protein